MTHDRTPSGASCAQEARHGMTTNTDKAPARAPEFSRRARARVAELELSGLNRQEAVATVAREEHVAPYYVRRHLGRGDYRPGPGRKPNAAKGKAGKRQWTAEVAAWLAAIAELPGMHQADPLELLQKLQEGALSGCIEAGTEPWDGRSLGLPPHKPFPGDKRLRSK